MKEGRKEGRKEGMKEGRKEESLLDSNVEITKKDNGMLNII